MAKFMEPTWGPPGSCRSQMGPMLAPWTLPSGWVPDLIEEGPIYSRTQADPILSPNLRRTYVLDHELAVVFPTWNWMPYQWYQADLRRIWLWWACVVTCDFVVFPTWNWMPYQWYQADLRRIWLWWACVVTCDFVGGGGGGGGDNIYIQKNARLCPMILTYYMSITDFIAEECEKIRQKRATLAKVDEVCFEIGPLMTQSPFRNTVQSWIYTGTQDDDVTKRKHFPRYWPFLRGIHWSPVNSPHKGQWRGALMLSFICARINGWASNREASDLRRNRAHYDVIVMGVMTNNPNRNIFTVTT